MPPADAGSFCAIPPLAKSGWGSRHPHSFVSYLTQVLRSRARLSQGEAADAEAITLKFGGMSAETGDVGIAAEKGLQN